MAEYLSPGVYIEEVSYRSTKAIAGVGTTTTGFVGPTRYGPVDLELQLVSSIDEYELTYGDGQPIVFGGQAFPNFMWHAARAFFTQGGTKLYVSRTVVTDADESENATPAATAIAYLAGSPASGPFVSARYPGVYGNMQVQITVRVGQNVLRFDKNKNAVIGSVEAGDVVMIKTPGSPVSPPTAATFPAWLATWDPQSQNWIFIQGPAANPTATLPLATITSTQGLEIRVITLAVTVVSPNPNITPRTWGDLALDPSHQMAGAYDSFVATFGTDPTNPANPNPEYGRDLPITFNQMGQDGLTFLGTLFAAYAALVPGSTTSTLPGLLEDLTTTDATRSIPLLLQGGADGSRPGLSEYEGFADPDSNTKTGLTQFEDVEDISIVAAPGSTYLIETGGYNAIGLAIMQELVAHCEKMRYRIAVLDCGNGEGMNQVRALRGQFDSSYAALYYPWIRILDPITSNPIFLPPSGFVCGIYARNDVTRAVYKAPANEVVSLAQGFEVNINKAQQDVLNPEGINCFRYFEGRGYRLWGARTVSSDTEWNYVNLRRYFAYVERSIDLGTQWAVFEPNGDKLWGTVRRSVQEFLLNEWQAGALMGTKPEEAFFVRCDQTTMTQSDIDNGRLVCLVGIAALRPAEFVIFRIGQWTGDRTS